MALCNVTGTVYLPNGDVASRREVVFYKLPDNVTADYLGAVIPEPVVVRTDSAGDLDVNLITGSYYGHVQSRNGKDKYTLRAIVPEAATADFADLITAVDPVEPLPAWLQQALQARDDAEASASSADASRVAAEAAAQSRQWSFDTEADAEAWLGVTPMPTTIALRGRDSLGDGLGGLYVQGSESLRTIVVAGSPYGLVSDVSEYRVKESSKSQRNAAAKCRVATEFFAGTAQMMSVSVHEARGDIRSPRLVFPNWFIDDANKEETSNGPMGLTASIEYPVGVFTQLTFMGSSSVTVPVLSEAMSDPAEILIPSGASFRVRTYQTNANGCIWSQAKTTSNGEASRYGASGVADQTMGGAVANMSADAVYRPIAVVCESNTPCVAIIGDSREEGVGDEDDGWGYAGYLERSLGSNLATINLSKSGDRASFWVASNTRRSFIVRQYATQAIVTLGINDAFADRTANQIVGNLAQIAIAVSPVPARLVTIGPVSTSTDDWATVSGQVTDPMDPIRQEVNSRVRLGDIPGYIGYYELADAIEYDRQGVWQIPRLTYDGVHATLRGYQLMQERCGFVSSDIREILSPPIRVASGTETQSGGGHGSYVSPASLFSRDKFQVGKGGANQVITPSTDTVVTWPSVNFDFGGKFTGNAWYPSDGFYRIAAHVGVLTGQDGYTARVTIRRTDGVSIVSSIVTISGTSAFTVSADKLIRVYPDQVGLGFEVIVNVSGTSDKTISGAFVNTFFEAYPV